MTATIIRNGLYFDGRGGPPAHRDLRLEAGRVVAVSEAALPATGAETVVDATGRWVTPGFIDIHTHYDAEIEVNPALDESLRHGVTTVFMGSCSLSAAVGDPTDLADMFTRVEAIPYEHLLPLFRSKKTWHTHGEYAAHLDSLPLGPNVASYVGYSAVRAATLGIERALDPRARLTRDELNRLEESLEEGLDAGFLGLSMNGLSWDKMGGDRFRSRRLPSAHARWGEVRRMAKVLRRRGLHLQALPNVPTKYEMLLYAGLSMSFGVRKALRTSVLSMMDLRANRFIWHLLRAMGFAFNRGFGARFRFQLLPVAFELWSDGFDNALFEEFGAGAEGLHLQTEIARRRLFRDAAYRQRFRRQWRNPLLPRIFHRSFAHATIRECPDRSLEGRTFAAVAASRGEHAEDTFLELMAEYGRGIRWVTVTGNDRAGPLARMIRGPESLIGFSDAGAHLRNMGFYNFPLRMLKFVRDAEARGKSVMPLGQAVWRLTGELGEWFGVDAGTLYEGARADVVVLDPKALDHTLDVIHEAPIAGLGGFRRLVRRNPKAVDAVFVAGERVVTAGEVHEDVGRTRGPGRFLKAGERSAVRASTVRAAPSRGGSMRPPASRRPLPAPLPA
ncbi:MAG: amidohydrolase family protein [Myxococcota bacterium]